MIYPPYEIYVIDHATPPWLRCYRPAPGSNATFSFLPSTTTLNYNYHYTTSPHTHSATMVSAIIYKPNEHADEYIVFVDDDKEVS